jgi:transcriptional antiterminator NusG
MDDDNQIAVVLTILFGRETPTEVGYSELEKIEL